nr:MAG TPA: hypothetical protein [Caudoviricetes sp.]
MRSNRASASWMPSGWTYTLPPPASSAPLITLGRRAPSSWRSASG